MPGNTTQRTPLPMQRNNKHFRTTLIEAATMAPRYSPALALLYDTEKQKGGANRAMLAVARWLVTYLMAADRGQRFFTCRKPATASSSVAVNSKNSSTRRLPSLGVKRLDERAQAPNAPVRSFDIGRRSQTQSYGHPGCAGKWKSGSSDKKEPRLRGQYTRRRNRNEITPALLPSASGGVVPS
jgi:hypothetical protein